MQFARALRSFVRPLSYRAYSIPHVKFYSTVPKPDKTDYLRTIIGDNCSYSLDIYLKTRRAIGETIPPVEQAKFREQWHDLNPASLDWEDINSQPNIECHIAQSTIKLLSQHIETLDILDSVKTRLKGVFVGAITEGKKLESLNDQRLYNFKMMNWLMSYVSETDDFSNCHTLISEQSKRFFSYIKESKQPFSVPLLSEWKKSDFCIEQLVELVSLHNQSIQDEFQGTVPDAFGGYLTNFAIGPQFKTFGRRSFAEIPKKMVISDAIKLINLLSIKEKEKIKLMVSSLLYYCCPHNFRVFEDSKEQSRILQNHLKFLVNVLTVEERREIFSLVNSRNLLMGLLEENTGVGLAFLKLNRITEIAGLNKKKYLESLILLYQGQMINIEKRFIKLNMDQIDVFKDRLLFKYDSDWNPIFDDQKDRFCFNDVCEEKIKELFNYIDLDPIERHDFVWVGRHGSTRKIMGLHLEDSVDIDEHFNSMGSRDLEDGFYLTSGLTMAQWYARNCYSRLMRTSVEKDIPVVYDIFVHKSHLNKEGLHKDLVRVDGDILKKTDPFSPYLASMRGFPGYQQLKLPSFLRNQEIPLSQIPSNILLTIKLHNAKLLSESSDFLLYPNLDNIFKEDIENVVLTRKESKVLITLLKSIGDGQSASYFQTQLYKNQIQFQASPLSEFLPPSEC